MAVVLDAVTHPPGDRAELVHDVIARSGARRRVELRAPAEAVDVRAEAWEVGATRVLRTTGTPMTLTRTARDVRAEAPELVAIALVRGGCTYAACGAERELGRDGVVVVDFTTPYTFSHTGRTGSFVAHLPRAELGLDVDVVRAAIPRLHASGLLPLVRGHLVAMSGAMDAASASPAVAADLGRATIDLTRALIVSAAGGDRARDVRHETLRARIVAHVRAHLREHDLTPARIAAEHHVSLRTLYNVWGDRDGRLGDFIVRERLERVQRELAVRAPGTSTFAVARRWGFVNAAHFSRRFRDAYGVSPTEWVAVVTSGPTSSG
ncbi:MAG TPA: helix-turn-helix domain-containing protein [Actinomycetospora sp.]|nr:helix-turn-helix domain-containing protein [Actinomycetospora sp.]